MKEFYKTFIYKEEDKLEREVTICALVKNSTIIINTHINSNNTNIVNFTTKNRKSIRLGWSIRRIVGENVDIKINNREKSISKGRAIKKSTNSKISIVNELYSKELTYAIINRYYRNVVKDVINKLKD